jgi:hypothetical protein
VSRKQFSSSMDEKILIELKMQAIREGMSFNELLEIPH